MRKILSIALFVSFVFMVKPVSADFFGTLFGDGGGGAKGEISPAPWSGDWWPRKKGFMIKGWPGHPVAPFEKYDQYVTIRAGVNPGTLAWESDVRNCHYNPKAEDWEGHCNGWAASSIMEPEPKERKIRSEIVFDTSDQKAILAELYMNTYCTFYGSRNWGRPNDNPEDIFPDQFHKLLLEQIGEKKGAIIADVSYDRQVWNFPLFKFESSWRPAFFDSKKLKVTTTCYYADDGVRPDFIGCKWFTITYTYNLFIDNEDNVVGGEWTGESRRNHPDFIWIPTADAPNPSGKVEENPNFSPKYVHEITKGPANANYQEPATPSSPESLLTDAGLNPGDLF
ncbi:MAG: hypothetical protein HQM10_15705 [Candidatus Riflebacteria bacterium]|nr:hypothetical protein [Candidatus Riflebacteria bacterium]